MDSDKDSYHFPKCQMYKTLGLGYGPRPAALGRTQDLWHNFSQYGPPGRQITYIYYITYIFKLEY